VGVADKLAAHSGAGLRHRAVSACLFDAGGRLLLQRRARAKYHFAGRWANAACTHPRPGEAPAHAIVRRLADELGVRPLSLDFGGTFLYRAVDPISGLVEHELDHVYVGVLTETPRPDPSEVMDWRYVDRADIERIDWTGPDYAPWLTYVLDNATQRVERLHPSI
jgi:isopentenyl-diphosphate delta-isomerase